MEFKINNSPSYASVTMKMKNNETIVAESGALIGMSADMEVTASTGGGGTAGGFFKGVKRLFSGESFFLTTFTAHSKNSELRISPKLIGDIKHVCLDGSKVLIVQGSSYLASTPGITIDTKFGGFKSLFSGERIFMVRVSGTGDLWINSYGAIYTKEIKDEYVVDTGHIVAFPETLDYRIKKVGNWKSTLLSGEGLVCSFTGQGTLYMQTHNAVGFGRYFGPKLPPRKR